MLLFPAYQLMHDLTQHSRTPDTPVQSRRINTIRHLFICNIESYSQLYWPTFYTYLNHPLFMEIPKFDLYIHFIVRIFLLLYLVVHSFALMFHLSKNKSHSVDFACLTESMATKIWPIPWVDIDMSVFYWTIFLKPLELISLPHEI